jgi:predicted transcriptional regulator
VKRKFQSTKFNKHIRLLNYQVQSCFVVKNAIHVQIMPKIVNTTHAGNHGTNAVLKHSKELESLNFIHFQTFLGQMQF